MKRRAIVATGAVLVGALLVVAVAWPALTLSLALASPSMQRALAPFYPEPARVDVRIPLPDGHLGADLYRPAHPRRALVLVSGSPPPAATIRSSRGSRGSSRAGTSRSSCRTSPGWPRSR